MGKSKKKKKKRIWLVLLLILLIGVLACTAAWYFITRSKPKKAVSDFLTAAQALNQDAMAIHVKDQDLSVLEHADLFTDAYRDFFRSAAGQMTFEISDLDYQGDTATVTASVTYPDGGDVYASAADELFTAVASSAASGVSLSQEEIQEKLASLLNAGASKLGAKTASLEISYPLENLDGTWVIASLDENTAKALTADFVSAEGEFNDSVSGLEESGSKLQELSQEPFTLKGENFTAVYKTYKIAKDSSGADCILIYYDYTNTGSSSSSPLMDITLTASQKETSLGIAIPADSDEAIDHYMADITPGTTVSVCQAFVLTDTSSDVALTASDSLSLGDNTVSQLLKLR